MTMHMLMNIALALPKCRMDKPVDGVQFIRDQKGQRVGEINWTLNEFTIYTNYEFCEQVKERLESSLNVEFHEVERPWLDEEPEEFIPEEEPEEFIPEEEPEDEFDEPADMTEAARNLYATPNLPDEAPF